MGSPAERCSFGGFFVLNEAINHRRRTLGFDFSRLQLRGRRKIPSRFFLNCFRTNVQRRRH